MNWVCSQADPFQQRLDSSTANKKTENYNNSGDSIAKTIDWSNWSWNIQKRRMPRLVRESKFFRSTAIRKRTREIDLLSL